MLYLGEFQVLTVKKESPQGLYLENFEGDQVLLPRVYQQPSMTIGSQVEVLVYGDNQNRPIASTERPYLTVNTATCLEVTDVTKIGAFCNWGVSKDLFIPFRNQHQALRIGQQVLVFMYLDEQSQRLVGSTILKKYFKEQADQGLEMGQEVDLLIGSRSDLGYKVIINQTYLGLIYANEGEELRYGDQCKGYIKPLRPDGKIDVSLQPVGVANIEPNAQRILKRLEEAGGKLPYTDKSDPETIRREFGISKKLFKKAIGTLYRQRLVLLKKDGIYLAKGN